MKSSRAWFACLVVLALLWAQAANARSATLAVRPAPPSQPMLSVETLTGEPIAISSLEAHSVVVGPLVATRVSLGVAHHEETGQLRLLLPQSAVLLEWETEDACLGEAAAILAPGIWTKVLGSANQTSFIYAQALNRGRAVVANIAEQTPLFHLEATLTDEDGRELAEPLYSNDAATTADIVVQVEGLSDAYRAGELAMVNARSQAERSAIPLRDAVVVIDMSASTAPGLSRRIAQAQAITRVAIGHLALVTFDQSSGVVFNGNANDFTNAHFEAIAQRRALGATSLESALRAIGDLAHKRDFRRVILFTDGNATAGLRSRAELASFVQHWATLGIRRLDVVAPEFGSDRVVLEALVTAGLPEHGRVISSDDDLAVQLEQPSSPDVPISIQGALAQKPWALASPGPNDEQWILARVAPSQPLRVRVGHSSFTELDAQRAWQPLFERYFEQQQLIPRIEKSKRGWFVLEHGKLTSLDVRRPIIRCSCGLAVSGRMPPEAIQRIVRLNFGRFRGCATQNHRPPVVPKGRVTVRFVIGHDGSVTSVSDAGSTVANEGFVRCVLDAFTTLRFAPPEGGTITVIYPLVFVDDKEEKDTEVDDSRSYTDDIPENYVPVKLRAADYPLSPRDVGLEAYEGDLRTVMQAIGDHRLEAAESGARGLLEKQPHSLSAYLTYGKVAELRGKITEARRAYGSLLDRFGNDARLHRIAAAWLAYLGDEASLALAADALRATPETKDERVKSERQLAWLHAQRGAYETALEMLTQAYLHQDKREPSLLNREMSILGAMALAGHPEHSAAIMALLKRSGAPLATEADLVIALESESRRGLALSIYASPEQGRFRATNAYSYDDDVSAYEIAPADRRTPYTLRVADRGWRGSRESTTGLGLLRVIDYDGQRKLHVELRPFILQTLGSEVDVGTYGNDQNRDRGSAGQSERQ